MKLAVRYFLCFSAILVIISSESFAGILTTWGASSKTDNLEKVHQVDSIAENKSRKNWANSQRTTLGKGLDSKDLNSFDTLLSSQNLDFSSRLHEGPALAISPSSPVVAPETAAVSEGKLKKRWSSLQNTFLGKRTDDQSMSNFDAPYSHTTFNSSAASKQTSLIDSVVPAYQAAPARKVSLPVDVGKSMVNQTMNSGISGSNLSMANSSVLDSSVEIFDLNKSNGMPSVVPPSIIIQSETIPNYGGGVVTSDSSVTIFDVGTDMSMQNSYGDNIYGNNVNIGDYSSVVSNGAVAGQIFFKHGSSRLGSGDKRKISNVADKAKFAPVNYITVEGFASRPTQAGTNNAQAHIINLRQSMKRSEKVSKELVKKGVPGEKIKTVSWGASKSTGNDTQDRRVDVVMGEK